MPPKEAGQLTIRLQQQQVLFINRLRKIVNLIHTAPNLDDLLVELRDDIVALLDAERITIYAISENGREIYSKVKAGDEIQEVRVAIDNTSISGYVANNQKTLVVQDAYNVNELRAIDPMLRFNRDFDLVSGFRTKQVLALPIMFSGKLLGVLQLLNKKNGESFLEEDRQATASIAETLAIAFHNHQKTRGQQLSKYDLLLNENILKTGDIEDALQMAKAANQSLEKILMEKFKVKKSDIGRALQAFYRLPFYEFKSGLPIPEKIVTTLDAHYLRNQKWVPLKEEDDKLFIAIDNPRALDKIDDLKRHITARVYNFMVALPEDIVKTIDYFWGAATKEVSKAEQNSVSAIVENIAAQNEEEGIHEEEKIETTDTDSMVIKLVNQVILEAYQQGVSDIHIEPYGKGLETVVRFRVDGVCREFQRVPSTVKSELLSRIKIMAGMDISNRRVPQDGKIQFKKFGGPDIELRVATLPTVGDNEDAVMRILAAHKPIPLDEIGMSENNLAQFKKLLATPYGILLVVGPTGSGKTTTLHSALGFLNRPEKKIWTAEDPVEITQHGLRQVQVNNKAGYTFAIAMRAFLRANPDIIMIGEMRDLETASIAIEASLTGHLVLSTLHTNSAPETIVRLLEIGIDPFNFADALVGVLAQRLARTLCKACKKSFYPTSEEFEELLIEYGGEAMARKNNIHYGPDTLLCQPKGCDVCRTGYKGRMGIHELLVCSDRIKSLIHRRATAEELREVATSQGMASLKQDGILKVVQGKTDLNQIRTVCIK